ncbi:MAG: asparaginase [Candidatus Izemoplasmatales bacterium]|jgi:L-asparaginase|nr:asparaginase [Candidatus Izemoplasmatales bacterium]MDD4595502.1 asparaginase [Candidatus Izemoplasmatales bacterium]
MGKVALLFTGGTISMKIDEGNHSVVPALTAKDIMSNLWNSDLYNQLEIIEFSELPSPSITPRLMLELSLAIKKLFERDEIDGAVIIHGTDTLEETAYFMDLVINSPKPIVVTGSMKSSSELGFDGINNLVSSILVAKSPKSKNKGTLVVLNDQINAASEVTKTNTLTLDTFKSMDFGPLGIVDCKEVIFYRTVNYSKRHIPTDAIEENVHLIKVCSGMDSSLINYMINTLHAKGIILEALGRGNVPPMMLEGINSAIKNNIPIVICSRCPSGRVLDTYGYLGGGKNLTDIGCILAPNLNGQKARILLMLALTITNDHQFIKSTFEK